MLDATSADCNANGTPDECDIAGGWADGNDDGVPDECQVLFHDDFEEDHGWSVAGNLGAAQGRWQRGVPLDCGLGDPATDADGSGQCFLTGNDGCIDVDGNNTRLTSQNFDLTGGGTIVYAYYVGDHPASQMGPGDFLRVSVSVPGQWPVLREYTSPTAGWEWDWIVIHEEAVPYANVKIRFTAADAAPDNTMEAAVDSVFVLPGEFPDCNDNGVPDLVEILSGAEPDLNDNGAPDSCDPDCNANGVPDDMDIDLGTSQDCDLNYVPDECDIAGGAADVDLDGVPDRCEPDCNANSVPDDFDIEIGVSLDCDVNGVPDECDIAEGAAEDCNANGIPDACDIDGGGSTDFDANGVPDECDPDCNGNGLPDFVDVTFGTSEDINANGVPDECECPPDLSGNGLIDVNDLVLIVAAWGPCTGPCPEDINAGRLGGRERPGDRDHGVGCLRVAELLAAPAPARAPAPALTGTNQGNEHRNDLSKHPLPRLKVITGRKFEPLADVQDRRALGG